MPAQRDDLVPRQWFQKHRTACSGKPVELLNVHRDRGPGPAEQAECRDLVAYFARRMDALEYQLLRARTVDGMEFRQMRELTGKWLSETWRRSSAPLHAQQIAEEFKP